MPRRSDRAAFGKTGKGYQRRDRVGHQIREVIADHLERTSNEALGLITLTGVDCSPDLRNATVYYTVYGDADVVKRVAEVLLERHGEFKTVVAKSVRMKYIPDLLFKLDTFVERGNRIERLLYEMRTTGAARAEAESEAAAEAETETTAEAESGDASTAEAESGEASDGEPSAQDES